MLESRSCNLSSTIQIFTKFLSLSLIAKAKTKWNKFLAVLLKESISWFEKFLHAPKLKRILQRVILLSVLVIFSTPRSIFSTISLSSCTMKCFNPSRPKESKKNMSVFGSMSKILHQWTPGICYYKRIFSFARYHRSMINKFIHIIRRNYYKIIL